MVFRCPNFKHITVFIYFFPNTRFLSLQYLYISFPILGFSLSGWMSTKSLSAVEDFSADHQQQLFEDLGLIPYLARDTCSLTSNTPTEYVGWNRG